MNATHATNSGALIKLRAAIIPAGEQTHFCHTIEILMQRALLLSPSNLRTGAACQLFLEVPLNAAKTEFESVQLSCTVQFSVLVGNLNQYRVGVKYTQVPAASERALEKLLS